MWDKHVTGENETKWGCREVTRCSVCNAITSQRHIIRECQRPGAEAIRRDACRRLSEAVVTHGITLTGRTLAVIQELLVHEDAHTIWTGMWSPEIREQVETKCPWTLKRSEFRQVKRALSVLVTGVLQLYRLATPTPRKRARGQETTGVRERQTHMEQWAILGAHGRQVWERGEEERVGREPTRSDDREYDDRRYDR